MYIEFKPAGALAQCFEAFWFHENTAPDIISMKLYPDSCSDIIIPLSGYRIVQPVFIGYMTRYKNLIIPSGEKLLGLRFNPGFSYSFIRDDMSRFTNKSVELSAIRKIDFIFLQDDFHENKKLNFTMLESILLKLMNQPFKENVIFPALKLINANAGFLRIEKLACSLNISRRYLEKEFIKYIGMTPKKFTQIERFRKILKNRNRKTGKKIG